MCRISTDKLFVTCVHGEPMLKQGVHFQIGCDTSHQFVYIMFKVAMTYAANIRQSDVCYSLGNFGHCQSYLNVNFPPTQSP